MSYINDLHRDEIRSGWLVTADAKKVWNRSLEIWAEVDRICRKHKIPYWAYSGTLIGAVRHGGFIPWDDDIDLMMLRPDFNRFVAVLKDELAGTVFEVKRIFLSGVQISHSQTTRIDDTYFNGKPQGISLAIIVLDIFDDGTPEGFTAINALCESYIAMYNYSALEDISRHGGQFFNDLDFLKTVSEIPDKDDKVKFFWLYAEQLFGQSATIASFELRLRNFGNPLRKEWFAETIYLPFETVELPAPKMFDEVLTAYYGDWRTPVKFDQQHMGYIHSADIPWREFLQRVDVKKLLPPDEEA